MILKIVNDREAWIKGRLHNTKLLRHSYSIYKRELGRTLDDVYDRCSDSKRSAWNTLLSVMRDLNGELLTVISYNTFTFTAGFTFWYRDEKYFCLATPSCYRVMKTGEDE